MRRRDLVAILGGVAAAWPWAAWPQQSGQMRHVGIFWGAADDKQAQSNLRIFVTSLQKLGWKDGTNIQFDYRYTNPDPKTWSAIAADLIRRHPDVILALGVHVLPFRDQTKTIPIIFTQLTDPVSRGIVASLARPGGNLTGFTIFETSIASKWLGLLQELVPRLAHVKMMFNPDV